MSSETPVQKALTDEGIDINTRDWVVYGGGTLLVIGTATIFYLATTTLTSVVAFGWLLLFAGLIQLAHAVQVRDWSGFFLYLLDGIARAAVGILIMLYPSSRADGLMLAVSFYLFVGGVFRSIGSTALEFPGWEWTAAAGLLSAGVAALIATEWPANSRFLIGFAVGVDLILYGWTLLMYAAAAGGLTPSYARRWRKP